MRSRLSLAGLLTLAVMLLPGVAHAARLVGGREQSAIAKAFFAHRAHRGLAIVSTRVSTTAPAWAIVRSVRPQASGRTTAAGHAPRLQSTYYRRVRGRVKPGAPPARARADLARAFRIAVVYSGSGSETVAYRQLYRSVCPGAGGFTDQQSDAVKPMSWSVRYVVDLDALQSAVRAPGGTVLVPAVSFDRSRSRVSAREIRSRTAIDEGCNGQPTTFECDATYSVGSPPDALLSFPAAGGLEIGVPTKANPSGDCDPSYYTLGPSLWDSGATTAVASRLRPGGRRPARQPLRAGPRIVARQLADTGRRRSAQPLPGRRRSLPRHVSLDRPCGVADDLVVAHSSPGLGSGTTGVAGSSGSGTVDGRSGSAGVPGSGSIGAIGVSGTTGVAGSVGWGTSSVGNSTENTLTSGAFDCLVVSDIHAPYLARPRLRRRGNRFRADRPTPG